MEVPTRYPVFIVGSPRSGTSILVDGLLGVGYHGFSEGNFLGLLRVIERDVDRHFEIFDADDPRVLISRIDRESLRADLLASICRTAADLYGDVPWIDKTGNPEMIEAIPILLRHWPASHFIFAKRRAIENVASRLKKFPQLSFDYHCADWARNMITWRQMRSSLPASCAIEVDQYEISKEPEIAAGRISRFLGLSKDAARRMAGIFETGRPQQTEAGSAGRVLTLAGTNWTEQQLNIFHDRCGREMREFGYSEDERYWLNAGAPSPRSNDLI